MSLDSIVIVWVVPSLASVAYVAADVFLRTPAMKVMRWGWVLVVLYTGPIGLIVYVATCRQPASVPHERFIVPLWRQATGSTVHCLAGDATGIIAAAAVTGVLAFSMGIDLVVEYIAGFAFGLLIFQALFMKGTLGVGYWQAVRKTIYPEWVSMNAVMAGMAPVMVILMSRNPAAMEPSDLRFWAITSLATIVGAALAYPVNVWLVAKGLKHGMATEAALGRGGLPLPDIREPVAVGHASSDDRLPPPSYRRGQEPGHQSTASDLAMSMVAAATVLLLAVGVWVAAAFGDLSMAAHG